MKKFSSTNLKIMPDNNKIEEFLQKLASCIERGEHEACVEEAARLAREMGVGAEEMLGLSVQKGMGGMYAFAYVLTLAAAQGLEGEEKAGAYYNAGVAAQFLKRLDSAEKHYLEAIKANPNYTAAHSNYAILLEELNRKDEAEEQYKKAIEANPKYAAAHYNYAILLEELNRKDEAEEQYKKAIEANPKYAATHSNYAILLEELNRKDEAEEQYKKAIEANPKYAAAHYNYAILLQELNRKDEAEEQYKKAIEANPKYAAAHSNYAILLQELNRKDEAEEQYKKAIEANPKYAAAHYNYAILLEELNRKDEAEEQYKKAIEANPKYAAAHSNYAILLEELNRKDEAEEQYKKAIEADPIDAAAHGAYGLLLIEFDKRKDARIQTELASNIFEDTGHITQSYLAKAWFYESYSKKNFNSKKFLESGKDADKAGEEYLKAAETIEGSLKDNLTLQGNVLKARAFVRKIPAKSWYRKIYYRFGKNPYISELIDNLKNAAEYYKKASLCPVGERQDICNACNSAISVFSEALSAMSAFIKGDNAEITKDEWLSHLERAREIYVENKLDNGVALVDTLKQLIKCVNELAEHRATGLHIQEEKLGKCYSNLIDVSEKLDGALGIIAEHAVDAIRDYAKKQGMGFVGEETKKSFLSDWIKEIRAAAAVIIAAAIVDWFFSLNLLSRLFDILKFLKSLI